MILGVITRYKLLNLIHLDFYDIIKIVDCPWGTEIRCIDVIHSIEVSFYLTFINNISDLKKSVYYRDFSSISQWFSLNDDLITERYKELIRGTNMLDLADW